MRTCRCGRQLDMFGHHRAACAVAGVLGDDDDDDDVVLFCDAWTNGSVCDALSMMIASSMTAPTNFETSPWVLPEHEKEHNYNT